MWWWLLPIGWMVFLMSWTAASLMTSKIPRLDLGGCESILNFLGQFLVIGIMVLQNRRLRRLFVECDGKLCTECAHSLRGLEEQGNCPECGHWFNIDRDRLAWREAGIELKKP